jgi:hypothetical protein
MVEDLRELINGDMKGIPLDGLPETVIDPLFSREQLNKVEVRPC